MATFVWDPAVQWPPPANITANYDVVAPDGVKLLPIRAGKPEESMAQPYLALITPLTGGGGWPGVPTPPIYHPGHPDHGLPAYPDQGLPGGGGGGDYPNQGLPGRPEYPSQGPVRPGRPVDPGWGWGGGERPAHPIAPGGGRPVDPSWGVEEGGPNRPDQGLPPGPAQPWVPPSGEELPPPSEDIADQVVLAIWNPGQQTWTVKTAPPARPAPHRG